MNLNGLRVGVAIDFAPVGDETYADRLAWITDLVAVIDKLAYHSISAGESYPDEVDDPMGFHAPNALMMLSAIAAHTSVPRLIASVVLLGAWPIDRLGRDAALTDQLCGGRLVLGLGLGPVHLWERRGIPRAEIGAEFEHDVAQLRRRSDDVVPRHPDGEPPIWIGGGLERSVERAVRLGDGYTASTGYPHDLVRRRARQYWQRRGSGTGTVSANRLCVIAATDADATDRAATGGLGLLNAYARAGTFGNGDSVPPANTVGLIGSPERVASRVVELARAGVNHLQLRVAPGATPLDVATDTLHRFAHDVAPLVAQALDAGRPPTKSKPDTERIAR